MVDGLANSGGDGQTATVEVRQTLGGRYQLVSELGRGGTAVVWRAHDEVLNRAVAIKLLAGKYAANEHSRARIRDEARAAANLSHPNIAQVYDFGESDDHGTPVSYVVMELINGPTLAQRVKEGPLEPRAAFRICGEVAAALAAAHAHGLVHRDVKPANVMVTPARAKVVDFGIAATAGPGRPDDILFGTPAYLAPERLLSDRIEPASDVYALGVLLYRLLSNVSPWSVDSTTQMLDAHVYIEPDPMPQLPGVPQEVTELVQGCLLKNPADRPTAAEASTILLDAADAPPEPGNSRDDGPRPIPATLLDEAGDPVATELRPARPAAGNGAPAAGLPERRKNTARVGPFRRRSLLVAGGGLLALVAAAVLVWARPPAHVQGAPAGQAPSAKAEPPQVASAAPSARPSTKPPHGSAGQATATATKRPAAGGAPRSGVRGGGATGSPSATPATTGGRTPPATEPPGPKTRTLNSRGGSVLAQCAKDRATLLDWKPRDPFTVHKVKAGPADTASIVFKNRGDKVKITVGCVSGTPTSVD